MSTADEVRSILREAGVPLTAKQVIEMLSTSDSAQSAYMFLHDAKKRGELETVMEDGKAAYRFASGAATVGRRKPATTKSRPPKPAASAAKMPAATVAENVVANARADVEKVVAVVRAGNTQTRESSLADLVGYTEAALQAYIESVVDKNIYGFLLNARDAARREYERVHT